ncbi:MAG: hypothetical protein AB3N09_06540 [Tateyamaria sp.]
MSDEGSQKALEQSKQNEAELQEIWLRRIDMEASLTSRISETSRFIGFGLVAWVFAVHTSDSQFAQSYVSRFEIFIGLSGMAGLLTIFLDYVQYLCAHRSLNIAMKNRKNRYDFDYKSTAYVFQDVTWRAKQWTAVLGSLLVAVTFGIHSFAASFSGQVVP